MSERSEHVERWHDDIAAFALDALTDCESALVGQHLHECEACAERLRWIAPAVDVIPATVIQRDPPPQLRERLMAAVASEAAPSESAESAAAPTAKRRRLRMPSFSFASFGLRPALSGLAAVLLLVAGIGGYALRSETGSSGPDAKVFEAASQIPQSMATGSLEVTGDMGSLHVVDLPEKKRGQVYQAWVQEPGGSEGKTRIHPSSVFVASDDGSAEVAIPRWLDGADRVMVTREPMGGSKSPHENSLLTAELG